LIMIWFAVKTFRAKSVAIIACSFETESIYITDSDARKES
jgi:hypothetical protein